MTSAGLSQAYRAAREGAGLASREHGLIVVSGRDRADYLQGLLTNDIVALKPGRGCYAAYLTPQGRMVTDLFVYELGDVILLVSPRATKDTLLAKLDQFIFSEDVQLGDVTDTFASVVVLGPQAAATIARATGLDGSALEAFPLHGNGRFDLAGQPLIVVRTADTGETGFELIAAREHITGVVEKLLAAGAGEVDSATVDVLRIEAGVPVFGRDMDEETIPLEAGIEERAISFTKGCYVGQEVIIRVLHRGHGRVARKLVGLVFEQDAAVPPVASALQTDGKDIGEVTSSAMSPSLGRPIALGYLKRDYTAPGTKVTTTGGLAAEVVVVPFRAA
jgi:tRNA-modifying protein YgfZ